MKTIQVIAAALLSLSLTQAAYANHDAKEGMHCNRKHAMEDADTNKDGVISHEEFNAAHQKMADEMFAKMDTNNDGKIDQAERDAMKEKMRMHGNMKDHKMDNMAK